ncbi:subunit Sec10 of exocyst complex [Chloropicon primus]|uniref:Subunit Sec10 of exocyst complex n=1 Tax=Chloropicon primus TaxID=1764295 RepID=A0A5B8MUX7_9CHLO|nr:subunit Sec10 of exocyst complex [Chloropicon primus]UPR03330.1 subunit Sec10 of exocyst complex [Chloropicon primus]|eukprot:QDZ24121.1 subunit Sec10 of exocyst complex [Chloropicon primus]
MGSLGGTEAMSAGEVVNDLVRDLLSSKHASTKGKGAGGHRQENGNPHHVGEGTTTILFELLTRVKEVRDSAERMEKHYLGRRDKILSELRRLAERRAEKDSVQGKTEEQTGKMVKVYETIEARVERVSNLSSHAGERLVRLEKRRDFARESKILLNHLSSFSKTEGCGGGAANQGEATLDKLDDYEAASTAIKLRTLGEKLLVGTSDLGMSNLASPKPVVRNELATIVERIQVYCDKLESRLIVTFDKNLRHKNFPGMRECSRSLLLFQGGGRLVSHYLASLPIFLETNPKVLGDEVAAILEGGANGNKTVKQLTDVLGRWYKHSLESVKKERVVINEVFPNAEELTNKLVQRLFEQNLQAYLTAVLAPSQESAAASGTSDDIQSFLRIVAAAYEKTRQLATGLQSIGCTGIDVDAKSSELFGEHLDEYPEIEFRLLEAIYSFKKKENLGKELSYDIIGQYFDLSKEAIARCMLLCLDQDKSDSMQRMFSSNSSRYASSFSLVDQVYQYMIAGLQTAMDATDKACSSLSASALANEPDLEALNKKLIGTSLENLFTAIHTLTTCIQRFEACVREEILDDKLPESLRENCGESLYSFVGLLENSVAQALSFGISNCLQILAKVLKSRQKRTEFCPQDDILGMGAMGKVTPACTVAVGCIRAVHALCVSKLGEANIIPFMAEFGESIFQTLKQHFGSFTYNPQGALRLKRDLAEYTDVFKAVAAAGVSKSFEQLSEQANLLVVMPESIPDLVEEDLKISKSVVLFWIKLRADYKTAKLQDGQSFDAFFS